MCGILGGFNAAIPNGHDLRHRGTVHNHPERHGDLRVQFHRLPITGGSANPFTGRDWTVWLVGEIYNYRELGHDLTEDSDVEAVAREFDAYGLRPNRFNGMFVILAYCHKSGAAYLIRDRFGIKQAYVRRHGNGFQFASEPKAFRLLEECPFGVSQFKAFTNIYTGGTMFKGVTHVPAGCILDLSTGTCTRYHSWDSVPLRQISFKDAEAETQRLLTASILRQYQHGRPKVGVLLSGGIDSGIIASVTGCDSFTAKMEQDETDLAESQAKGRHYTQTLTLRERDHYIPLAMKALDDPRLGASWTNYAMYELASKFVTVVMDGSGSDELFGGYPWRYTAKNYRDVVNRSGAPLSTQMRGVFNQVFPTDNIHARMQFDIDHFLQGLFIVSDRMSMAHTVEARVPFCDNDLWNFVLSLPIEYRMNKALIRNSPYISDAVRNAPKRGFTSGDYSKGRDIGNAEWIETCLNLWRKNHLL